MKKSFFSLLSRIHGCVLYSPKYPTVQLIGISCILIFGAIIAFNKDITSSTKYFYLRLVDEEIVKIQFAATRTTEPSIYHNGEEVALKYPPSVGLNFNQPVYVVISDSGVTVDDPNISPFLDPNPKETVNFLDDDHNGCIDDLISGCNFISGNGDVSDGSGHGTHVAGTIIGIPEQAIKLPKQNSNVHLIIAKFIAPNGTGTISNAVKTIKLATKTRLATGMPVVVNVSWICSSRFSRSILEEAVTEAGKAGVMIVAAAGNDDGEYLKFPAAYSVDHDNVIAVGALDPGMNRASFSNRMADVAAPGVNIKSAGVNGDIVEMDGTSMATPFVTQVVALLLQLHPKATPKEIKSLLIQSCDVKSELIKDFKGGKILNAKKILRRK